MNISLSKTLEAYVEAKVKEGLYNSASEVIRSGLRLLIEQEQAKQKSLQMLNNEIEAGIESLSKTSTTTWHDLKNTLKK